MQYSPSPILKPFVKSYSVISIDNDLSGEVFYPSGHIDLVLNISGGNAATTIGGRKKDTPRIELLGHLTVPTRLDAGRGTRILIARLYPHAPRLFFRDSPAVFTNYATDLFDVHLQEMSDLHESVMEQPTIEGKVRRLDTYLAAKLRKMEGDRRKMRLTAEICRAVSDGDGKPYGAALSHRFGVSERFVQGLFQDRVGLTPQGLYSVVRFNRALDLLRSSERSLTAVALDCGYYDQPHFIKEFRKFTGVKPSRARRSLTASGEEFQQVVNIGF